MGAVIEFEKRQAVKRMRDGMVAKAATGRKATGQYAFGYQGAGKGRDRDAAPDLDEQETIREIMELRGINASYRQIATMLNDSGHKPKRARRWSPMTVKRIYDRETKRASPPLADTLVVTLMDDHG
jgi:DNA invertase Pin-like site-specific DNA recombinase